MADAPGPIVSVPSHPPAPYDAASTADAGPWVKVETVPAGGSGHGWDSEFGDGPGPWRQT